MLQTKSQTYYMQIGLDLHATISFFFTKFKHIDVVDVFILFFDATFS